VNATNYWLNVLLTSCPSMRGPTRSYTYEACKLEQIKFECDLSCRAYSANGPLSKVLGPEIKKNPEEAWDCREPRLPRNPERLPDKFKNQNLNLNLLLHALLGCKL
jgi:hypothetical protein